jgi:Arc/MetJ family transcription regulator
MGTKIEIDDQPIQKALRLSGLKTKRAVVEVGLRVLIRVREQEEILKLPGKVRWVGILDENREDPELP